MCTASFAQYREEKNGVQQQMELHCRDLPERIRLSKLIKLRTPISSKGMSRITKTFKMNVMTFEASCNAAREMCELGQIFQD